MANQHHAAVELVDGFCQRINGLNIQVIGGLVKEQHVRVLPGQPGKAHPALLTIGQVPDRRDLEEISGVNLETIRDKKLNVLDHVEEYPNPTCCFPVSP